MPRPRGFQPEEALRRAMEVFWEHGFEGTSIQMLVGATGVNRASLYEAFGGKRALFLEAVRHYGETVVAEVCRGLSSDPSPLAAIESTLRTFAAPGGEDCRGCMLTNTIVEFADRDDVVAGIIQDLLERIEGAFHSALERAAAAGEIERGADARALARHLVGSAQGLVVLGKSRAGGETMDDIVGIVMETVRSGIRPESGAKSPQ